MHLFIIFECVCTLHTNEYKYSEYLLTRNCVIEKYAKTITQPLDLFIITDCFFLRSLIKIPKISNDSYAVVRVKYGKKST